MSKKNLILFLFCTSLFANDFTGFDLCVLGEDGVCDVYVIGEESQSYTAQRWIERFAMNKFETCYDLWYSVRLWAEKNGYSFQNPGQEGSRGKRGAKPTEENKFQPVTMISWHDAIVWCNALSEKMQKIPCYTYNGQVLRDSSDTAVCDLAECNWDVDGFRLPTESEWEYASRKTVSGFQSGALASGQVDKNGNDDKSIFEDEVAWSFSNTKCSKTVGTTGTPFLENATAGTGNSNAMGLFDMSGNILEACWDWKAEYQDEMPNTRSVGVQYGAERIYRGGSWSEYTMFIYCGDRYAYDPNEVYNYLGFRFCTSDVKSVQSFNDELSKMNATLVR